MVADQKKNVGVLVNQDELRVDEFRSFMDMTLENYNAGPVIPVKKRIDFRRSSEFRKNGCFGDCKA